MPEISVIMGICNCEKYLPQAVQSVINQTFTDWELIMCDDGSIDNTYNTAVELARNDSRIRVLKNETNTGLPHTLNKCVAEASANILARMDGDDICDSSRFEKELNLLKKSGADIVSCGMYFFDDGGVYGKKIYKNRPVKADFAGNSPFCHAGSMFKKASFAAVNGYSEDADVLRVEDFDLWFRMYENGFSGVNTDECLYLMRDDRNAVLRKKFKYRINEYKLKKRIAKAFNFGIKGHIKALRPIILGLCPPFLYSALHKAKLRGAK